MSKLRIFAVGIMMAVAAVFLTACGVFTSSTPVGTWEHRGADYSTITFNNDGTLQSSSDSGSCTGTFVEDEDTEETTGVPTYLADFNCGRSGNQELFVLVSGDTLTLDNTWGGTLQYTRVS